MKRSKNNIAQAGFSMIELLIVIVLTLIIMAAVLSLMRGTINTANSNYETTSATQNLRNAQEFINRDVLTLGDGVKSTPNIWLPTRFVTAFLTNRNASAVDPTNIGYISIGAVISDNDLPAGLTIPASNPAMNFLPRSDRMTLLSIDKSFPSISLSSAEVNPANGWISVPAARIGDFKVGEIYFLSNGISATFGVITNINRGNGRIFWRDGDSFGINKVGNSGAMFAVQSPLYAMSLSRVNIIQYFVDSEEKLIRRVFGVKDDSFIDSVIAEHLVELQFRYILKPSGGNRIFDQPRDVFDLDDATSVRMIEPRVVAKTAYPLTDGEYHYVEGATQLAVRNLQFSEALTPQDKDGNTQLPNPGPTPQITP